MSAGKPYLLRWGILGCGGISTKFVKDLLLDPTKTRNVEDVAHKVVAVGARDLEKAKAWATTVIAGDSDVKAYGSYEDLVNDKDIDAIYVGTPHTFHYIHSALALNAGKHVLCEKPFTSNAAELRALIALAKEKNRFLMEAMWTRFQPTALAVSEIIQTKALGEIRMLHADLHSDIDIENTPTSDRMINPDLGGGALLDLGPYPLVWAIIALFEHPDNKLGKPSNVSGSMIKTPRTGVDATTVFVLEFASIGATAVLSCGLLIPCPETSVTIRFRNGNILLSGPPFRPTSLTVQYFDGHGPGKIVREEKRVLSYEGGGWQFQADEVARCIRDDKTESTLWSLDKSLLEMDVFDEVRKQGGYVFPPGIEQVV
ncbi:NAD(P)-binding protein [Clavulina sp. PMI_390]|nr:NAD(P)-binding protein [Clavulina sp. PMI_390]